MTCLVIDIEASKQLIAELRNNPRFTEPEVPSQRYITRLRDTAAELQINAVLSQLDQANP